MSETLNFPFGTGVVTGPLELTQQFTAAAEDGRPFQFHLQPEQIKRIARLLTEEDAVKERDRRRRTFAHRCHACGSTNGYQYGSDAAEVTPGLGWHCNDCEMERWESAQIRATSRPAAYRAATEAEQ